MSEFVRNTRSVCPVCLKNIPARLEERDGAVYMEKDCPQHGHFSVIVWRGKADFAAWRGREKPLGAGEGLSCPAACGLCAEHRQGSCCVLLEVTRRCNLRCRFCFADGAAPEPTLDELKAAVKKILGHGSPLIQLSGGEPTLRDDLPELVRYIFRCGGRYAQLNSNGIRLAEDEDYVRRLAEAGLSFVFLQFDGTDDGVFETLRGRPLLETKRRAIEMCGKYNIGVTLVPTVVRGVNDGQIGEIIRYGAALSPAVRGVHFQPVSYFGRYPGAPDDPRRYTLDELIAALGGQAGISPENIMPSRCDHPGCGLHAAFVVLEDGTLYPLTKRRAAGGCGATTAAQNRDYIGSRWKRGPASDVPGPHDIRDMDYFLSRVKSHGFTVTAMAFQDAMNLDIERLRRCSLHVYDAGALKPFCARYLTAMDGETNGLR